MCDNLATNLDELFFFEDNPELAMKEVFRGKMGNLINLNSYPKNIKFVTPDLFTTPYVHEYKTIDEFSFDYKSCLNNLLDFLFIPYECKLKINGMYIYCAPNSHNIDSLYAYPTGYEDQNQKNIYWILLRQIRMLIYI